MKFIPFWLVICAVVNPSSATRAQEASGQDKAKTEKPELVREIVIPPPTQRVADEPPEQFSIKHISAVEPRPAFKYRLYPSRGEMKPGNSVPFYYRLLYNFKSHTQEERQHLYDTLEKYDDQPLSAFIEEDARTEILRAVNLINESQIEHNLKEAVYREQTVWDWQLNQLKDTEPISFIMEEAQDSREIARVMHLRTRLQAAEGQYDKALESCLLTFKTARDIAEPTTLINDLVGIAMASISLWDIRDMICQTDCPNLYWALATLPDPLISMRDGIEYEMAMPEIMFPVLRNPQTAVRSPEEWSRLVREMFSTIRVLDDTPGALGGMSDEKQFYSVVGSALLLRSYPTAKRELIAQGILTPEDVKLMSVGQVVAIYQSLMTRTLYDNYLKYSYVEFSKSESARSEISLTSARTEFQEPVPIAILLMPAVHQAKQAEIRLQSKIKGLMAVEAIRMHAAVNGGVLPNSLDDIKVVPVPDCPLTGKPYVYQANKDGASIIVPWASYGPRYSWQFHFKNN